MDRHIASSQEVSGGYRVATSGLTRQGNASHCHSRVDLCDDVSTDSQTNRTMSTPSGKRTALRKMTLNNRSVEALVPENRPFIAWDDCDQLANEVDLPRLEVGLRPLRFRRDSFSTATENRPNGGNKR